MLDRFKEFWAGTVLHPVVRLFIRLGISPDAVTLVGTDDNPDNDSDTTSIDVRPFVDLTLDLDYPPIMGDGWVDVTVTNVGEIATYRTVYVLCQGGDLASPSGISTSTPPDAWTCHVPQVTAFSCFTEEVFASGASMSFGFGVRALTGTFGAMTCEVEVFGDLNGGRDSRP